MRRYEILAIVSFGVLFCIITGCGDDSSDTLATSDGGDGDGDKAQRSDHGPKASSDSSQPLRDNTAGKACKTAGDCANGKCLTAIADVFGGASMDAPGGYCSAACTMNTDCGEGGVCSGAFPSLGGGPATPGSCFKGCNSAEECREGYRCVNGLGMAASGNPMDPIATLLGPNACQPLPSTTQLSDGLSGKTCESDEDCGKGRCLKAEGMMTYPNGYCSGNCLQDTDCGAGGSCTLPALGGGAGSCYLSCQTHGDGDCREGYRCRTNGSRRQCLPGAAPLGDGVAGRQCEEDADCGGTAMSCVTNLGDTTAPGGYCSISCTENSDCGADGACVGGLGAAFASLFGATGVCYRACLDSSSCRTGYVCGQPANAAGGLGALTMMAVPSACVVAPAAEVDAGTP